MRPAALAASRTQFSTRYTRCPYNHYVLKSKVSPDRWDDDELRAAVDAYLQMLALEQAGTPYNKAEHNRQLRSGELNNSA